MSYIIRYDMNYPMTDNTFVPVHPQLQLKKDGMKELRSEPVTIADCWFFEVEELVDPLPEWYKLSHKFKFS